MSKLKLTFVFLTVLISMLAVSCGECKHPDEATEIIAPTCTAGGVTVHTCPDCDTVYESDHLPPLGHSFVKTVTEPDCTNEGFTVYTCVCGLEYIADVEAPLGHKYDEQIISADCESQGSITHICSVCDFSFTDSITAPYGHTFVENKVDPTCTSKGYTEYLCDCGFSYVSDVIAPTEHNFVETKVDPSCEECGHTEYVCACGLKYEDDFVAPLGHSILSSIIKPTCTESGYTNNLCECGYTYISDPVPPLGHEYLIKVTPPTCTEAGFTTYECSCSYSYVSDVTAPIGHDFASNTVYPTVMDFGYTTYLCKCGFSYRGDFVFYNEFFGSAYAENDEVLARGIDISKYNHPVAKDGSFLPMDWAAIKNAGIDYVIIKAGSTLRENGTLGGIEPTFEDDYAAAKAAGLDIGVYFFTYATDVDGMIADAEMLLHWLDGKQFEYPIYLDIEDVPNEDYYPSQIPSPVLTEMCLNFFSILQKNGYYTGLYVNNEFLFNIMQTEHMIDMFEIWYARYPSGTEYIWDVNKYGEHLGMWQYSDKGSIAEIPDMPFDFNFAYKNYPSIIKKYGFNGFSSK